MKRKYQIFLSSTYIDLVKERKAVIKNILDNNHFPVGMEMFIPSPDKQWKTIVDAIDTTDIYILIVGHRYGSIDSETGISYTEKEYNYAVKKGIPIVAFISNSTFDELFESYKYDQTNAGINENELLSLFHNHKYDENQENITRFKKAVSEKRLVGYFNTKTAIDIQPAINKEINNLTFGGWVRATRLIFRLKVIVGLLAVCTTLFIALYSYEVKSGKSDVHDLLIKDSLLFQSAQKNNIEYARSLPNESALGSETNFGYTLQNTTDSFFILSTGSAILVSNLDHIVNCLRRGVIFHVITIDTASLTFSGLNRNFIFSRSEFDYDRMKSLIYSKYANLKSLYRSVQDSIATYNLPGKFEIKVYSGPVYYQFWIKDAGFNNSLVHFNIAHFDGFKPIFRITHKSSPRLTELFHKEFNLYWSDSEFIKKFQ